MPPCDHENCPEHALMKDAVSRFANGMAAMEAVIVSVDKRLAVLVSDFETMKRLHERVDKAETRMTKVERNQYIAYGVIITVMFLAKVFI